MKKLLLALVVFCSPLLSHENLLWKEYKMKRLVHLSVIPGWCSQEKAEQMMNLIEAVKPTVCVEIGVFGGSSIYPTALALAYNGQGMVYAIDPWSTEECLKGYEPTDPNYIWWSKINLNDIYTGFIRMLERHGLTNFCKVMRTTSEEAVRSFQDQSIDILHVDGNHTENESFKDVDLFFPKVKDGGYIWLDDLKWTTSDGKNTLEKAYSHLLEKCDFILAVDNNNCVLLRKKSR